MPSVMSSENIARTSRGKRGAMEFSGQRDTQKDNEMGGHQGELHLVVIVSLGPFYNGFIPLDKRRDLIRFCVKWFTVSQETTTLSYL